MANPQRSFLKNYIIYSDKKIRKNVQRISKTVNLILTNVTILYRISHGVDEVSRVG